MVARKKTLEPWMLEAAREHIESGCSFGSFAGKYQICIETWNTWGRTIPEFIELKKEYHKYLRSKKRVGDLSWCRG